MGDGGTGIGGAHLINAARRNIGLTVLVFNNFNFGMTGGQHSTTTPTGAVTATTPEGNLERPLDICATVGVNGAGYVWRGTTFDEDLPDRIAEAIRHPGFALLDIWELCTAYFVPANKATRTRPRRLLERLGLPDRRPPRARPARVRRRLPGRARAAARRAGARARDRSPVRFASTLARPVSLVVAGSAGGQGALGGPPRRAGRDRAAACGPPSATTTR